MSGENKSVILPLLAAGNIKYPEESVKIQVNCRSETSGTDKNTSNVLDTVTLKTLFPEEGKNRVPLVGGSIVKLELSPDGDIVTFGEPSSGDIPTPLKLDSLNARYADAAEKLREYIEDKVPAVPSSGDDNYVSASSLVKARVAINRALEEAPSLSKEWQTHNVPILALSKTNSSNMQTHTDLQKKIDENKGKKIRIKELKRPLGYFKFVPISFLQKILEALVPSEEDGETLDYGLKEYYGISGESFETLKTYVGATNGTKITGLDDDKIVKILLELLPILRVHENYLTSNKTLKNLGYFTVYGKSIYLKTPDLSGRDSNGDAVNIYDLGQETSSKGKASNINYCFELALNLDEYNAKAFEYVAPPSIEVNEISVEYPEVPKTTSTSGVKASLQIAKDGLDKNKVSKFSFYLSPIFPPKSSVSSRGLYTTRSGVEVFSAPNLLQPYYLTDNAAENLKKRPVLNYPDKVVSSIIEKFSKSFKSTNFSDYAGLFEKPKTYPTNFGTFTFSDGKTYSLNELGLPLTEDLTDLNIEKLEDILGEANRPEMLLGYRDGGGPINENEQKFYDPKIYGSRNLLASNRPNIILDQEVQLPALWIPLKLVQNNDDGIESHILEIPYDSSNKKGPRAGLDMFNSLGVLEFALYVVDDHGQIIRAPGKNIRITPNSPSVSSVAPNGYKKAGKVVNLATTLSPKSVLAPNSLTGWTIEGEGFSAPGTDPIINFYSDEEGKNLITSIRNGQKFGPEGHPVTYDYGQKSITVSTKATFGDILPALVGNYYIGIQLESGSESTKKIPFYIAEASTNKDDLPPDKENKIKFSDSFGVEVKGFGKAVDSIPIIQDSINNANITFKLNKKDFTENGKLYAYLAVLDDKQGLNKDILTSDLGWLEGGEHKKGAIISKNIKTATSDSASFLIPTALGWEFGTPDFKRQSARKATLKFPGTSNVQININRFSEITAKGEAEYPAYILLVNAKLYDGEAVDLLKGGSGPKGAYDYAVIPIGTKGGGPHVLQKKPFVRPPEVLGLIAELPASGGEARVVSNIKKEVLTGSYNIKDNIEDLSLDKLGAANQDLRIISSNGLKRLAVIFSAPEVARMKKFHDVLIGNKSMKDNCVSIKSIGNNYVVANYEDITDIKSEGWTEIVVEKKDKRFGCSYDSTLYNKVTVDVEASEEGKLVDENGLLVSGKDLLIPKVINKKFYNYNEKESMSTVIFPGRNIELSPLPILGSISHGSEGNALVDNSKSYYYFSNPVKIKPSVDHVFGFTELKGGTAKVWGMSLTDSPIKDGDVKDEIIKIDRNGQTSVAQGINDIADSIKKAKEEAEKVLENLKKRAAELEEGTQEWVDSQKQISESETKFNDVANQADEVVAQAQALDKEAADQEAMDAALAAQGGADGSGGSGALDSAAAGAAAAAAAADAAAAAAADAAAAIADALAAFNALSDTLSSAVQGLAAAAGDAAEALSSSLSARPNDFVKVDLRYCYIDKSAVINEGQYISYPSEAEKKTHYKIIVSYKFSQNAAIKFNVPEIVSAGKTLDEINTYTAYGENPFSKLSIKGDEEIFLKVIGAGEDTKYEVAGQRVKELKVESGEGLYTHLKIRIPSLNVLSVFGLGDCITISATNSNSSRMKLGRQMGNDLTINLEDAWGGRIFGEGRNQQGPSGDLAKYLDDLSFLKFTFVKLGKVAGGAKEALQSFCDFSFHLTAELSLQLRNLQVLMVPIKVIFCIIDVICALLNPWRLAFAIIRLFLCLYDLILLLPPIAVPAMYLALLIHLLDLLLCVILKIISTINAINEVVTALNAAIEQKNYPAIVALEEALNEHIFSLETDLSVLEPIITILALFMELLQLAFAFPCRPGSGDPGDEACIDPSQLAGIILGKVAPTGKIAPNVLLPLAQAYTRLPADSTYSTGNSPPGSRDNDSDMSMPSDWQAKLLGDIVVRPQDERGSVVVKQGTPGEPIPNHINNSTGETYLIEEGGYFVGDLDGDGSMDNVYYPTLRTQYANGSTAFVDNGEYYGANDGYFDATFALSFTKSTKTWSFFTGPDPRVVRYQFDSDGVSSDVAWWTYWLIFPIFFSKKTVSELQTLDTPPMFLKRDEATGNLVVDGSGGPKDFISPIDGFNDFLSPVGGGYQPKPLTVTFELNEPGVNPDTFDAEFTPVTVTKTFGNIPMIAVVDDDFNVYFVEKDGVDGGIKMNGSSIESINLKMINYPSAPKKKTGREKRTVFSNQAYTKFDSDLGEDIAYLGTSGGFSSENIWSSDSVDVDDAGNPLYLAGDNKYEVTRTGEAVMAATANAAYLRSQIVESSELQYNGAPVSGSFDYLINSKQGQRNAGEALLVEWDGTTAGAKTLKGKTLTFRRSTNEEDYGLSSGPIDEAIYGPTGDISIKIVDPDVGLTGVGFEILWQESFDSGIPYPALGIAYDFGTGTSKEQGDIGESIDSVKVYDFPQFYIVDMRQLADDIAAACGASGPAELLTDLPGFEEPFGDNIQDMMDCMQAFMNHFTSESVDDQDIPLGLIPKLRYALENGVLPQKISVEDAVSKYEVLRQCVEDQIDKSCRFVVNPLNTGFKLLGDTDETPLEGFVDPEQTDPGALGSAGIVDELEFDTDLDGFPSITGAMEYASGIGDTIVAEAGTRAMVEFFPRDCYDEPMHKALDMTNKMKIDIVSDETGSAKVVPPFDESEDLVVRDEERYLMAVQTESPGKVVIKGSVCGVTIQAVTDRGIVNGLNDALGDVSSGTAESLEGCVDDASAAEGTVSGVGTDEESFAPGQLMKVDRNLTILFVPAGAAGLSSGDGGPGGLYGDGDRDASARSAKPNPQVSGTKLEN